MVKKGIVHLGSFVLAGISLCILFLCCLRLTVLCANSGPSGRYYDASHFQKLSTFGSRQPLEASSDLDRGCLHWAWLCRGAKLCSNAGFIAAQSPGVSQQMNQGTLGSASANLHLLASCQT